MNFRTARRPTDEIVILENIKTRERFMTSLAKREDGDMICRTNDGELTYRILGYAKDVADGQTQLYGRTFPLR
jgi:hypothetical protein